MTFEDKRVPAGGVVVIGSLSESTQARLTKAAVGKLARISKSPPTHVVETSANDLRKFADRINKVVGVEGLVAPLLVDNEGNRMFPTGRLQVRFKKPVSDHVLTKFAKEHNVELARRNKWAPQQAEFSVRTDDTRYFPDVTAELKEDKNVAAAWPDVRAAFKRETL